MQALVEWYREYHQWAMTDPLAIGIQIVITCLFGWKLWPIWKKLIMDTINFDTKDFD